MLSSSECKGSEFLEEIRKSIVKLSFCVTKSQTTFALQTQNSRTHKLIAMTANSKECIQYMTATLMVVSGVVLSFISFFTKGDVTDGVLWYMAQGLTFAGAIFGVSVYFKTKLGESENRIKQFFVEQSGEAERVTEQIKGKGGEHEAH